MPRVQMTVDYYPDASPQTPNDTHRSRQLRLAIQYRFDLDTLAPKIVRFMPLECTTFLLAGDDAQPLDHLRTADGTLHVGWQKQLRTELRAAYRDDSCLRAGIDFRVRLDAANRMQQHMPMMLQYPIQPSKS